MKNQIKDKFIYAALITFFSLMIIFGFVADRFDSSKPLKSQIPFLAQLFSSTPSIPAGGSAAAPSQPASEQQLSKQPETVPSQLLPVTDSTQEIKTTPFLKDFIADALKFNNVSATVNVSFNVKNARNITVDSSIAVLAESTNSTETIMSVGVRKQISSGKKKIRVIPRAHPVKEILFNGVDVATDKDFELGLDDPPEFGNYVEVYAINPTGLNFTSANVTATAKGTELYKCKNWNFTARNCADNNWTKIADITPGQNYTFTLTPEDPGYAETLLNSPSSTTGGWSTPDGAYADGGTSASITSAKPSTSQIYSGYGFNHPSDTIIDKVRIRYDAKTAGNEQIRVQVSWDGGTTWSAQQTTTLTTTETTYWYDVTTATTWDLTKLNNTNFRVRVDAYTAGAASAVYLDWIPVEVTATINAPVNVNQAHYRWRNDDGLLSKLYGGTGNDVFRSAYVDGDYIYAVGSTASEGQGGYDGLIVKFNKSDLTIAGRKTYGGIGTEYFSSVYVDVDYVYAVVGYTNSEGQGGYDGLIMKFNKSDLTIAARKTYGGTGWDWFAAVYVDGDYIYAVGQTASEGQGGDDALIMKFNKSDLTIAGRKTYGGTGNDWFHAVYVDGNYVYAVGSTASEGQGGYDGLIMKFNKSDLTIAARKIYGGTGSEFFHAVYVDGDYVYAVGDTNSEGQGGDDALIMKFNKLDLTIAGRKTYGGTGSERSYSVYVDGNYVYAVGSTASEGQGGDDALIMKFNKSDLTIAGRKTYGGTGNDYFYSVYVDGDYVYEVGSTGSAGQGVDDALIVKSPKDIVSGTMNTAPSGFTYQDSAKTLADSAKILADSAKTLANSAQTLADSVQTLADSARTLSSPYKIGEAGPWKQTEDTANTNQIKNENVRLRFSIKNTGGIAENYNYRLQAANKTEATCEAQTSGWSSVATTTGGCGSAVACMTNSTWFTDNDPTSNQLTSEGTWTAGKMVEDPSNQTSALTLNYQYFTEVEYNFQFTDNAAGGATYCLRATNAETALNGYAKVAQITITVAIAPTFTQNFFRFYINNDALDPTDPWPAGSVDLGENTGITSSDIPPASGENLRIRMSVQVGGVNLSATSSAFKLQFAERVTTCSAILSWTDFGVIDGGTIWRGFNATPVDGTALSGDPPTAGALNLSVSDRAGTYEEANNTALNPYAVLVGEDVEYDWVVQDNGAFGGTNYCFRMTKADGIALNSYNYYPALITAGFRPKSQNWRWYDDETNETPIAPLAAENVAPADIANQNIIKLRLTIKETAGVAGTDIKYKLQFSESSDFSSGVNNAVEIGNCATNSLWCYGNGVDSDNDSITTLVLTDSTAAGTHNESGTSASTFDPPANSAVEYEFTIKHAGAQANAVYFFRAFDVTNNVAVSLNSGETFPSLSTQGGTLTFSIGGLSAGTLTEGITTDVATTPLALSFGTLSFGSEIEAAQRLTATTNATEGYQIFMFQRQGLINSGSSEIAPVSGTNESPTGWAAGCVSSVGCYGYHAGDDTLAGASTRFAPDNTYAKLETTAKEVAFNSGPVTNESTDVIFKTQITNQQDAGNYLSSIVYIIVPTF